MRKQSTSDDQGDLLSEPYCRKLPYSGPERKMKPQSAGFAGSEKRLKFPFEAEPGQSISKIC